MSIKFLIRKGILSGFRIISRIRTLIVSKSSVKNFSNSVSNQGSKESQQFWSGLLKSKEKAGFSFECNEVDLLWEAPLVQEWLKKNYESSVLRILARIMTWNYLMKS